MRQTEIQSYAAQSPKARAPRGPGGVVMNANGNLRQERARKLEPLARGWTSKTKLRDAEDLLGDIGGDGNAELLMLIGLYHEQYPQDKAH